jgi:hypothetical protein
MDIYLEQILVTLLVATVMGVIAWIVRRISIKTKVEVRVNKLEERVGKTEAGAYVIEALLDKTVLATKAIEQTQADLKWIREGFPVLFRGVMALLQAARDGKTNGEVEEALKEVNRFLTQSSGENR